ncbi:MAG: hypothetical protein FWF51_01360 [Chitinivibrionia bacterium]|nr:hypothetical protein [Chitinivibrionia bacterium]
MANKIRKKNTEPQDLDLTLFMALMVCLIPILLSSAEFAKIATVDIALPKGRGSQTQTAQTDAPPEEEKLLLTVMLSDSALTIGAKTGFLPSIMYREFHDYRSRRTGNLHEALEYDPKLLNRRTMEYGEGNSRLPIDPETQIRFIPQEREEIKLVAYDMKPDGVNFNDEPLMGYYSITRKDASGRVTHDGGDLLVKQDGQLVDSIKVGDEVYALATQFSSTVLAVREAAEGSDTTEVHTRRKIVIENIADYERKPVSAYDLLKSLLVQIRERFRDIVEDKNDLIIVSDDHIIYDKIIQVMDVARSSNLTNISIARFREQGD